MGREHPIAEKHLLEIARGDRPLAVELLTPLIEDSKPNREDATHTLIQGDVFTLGGQAQPMPGQVNHCGDRHALMSSDPRKASQR